MAGSLSVPGLELNLCANKKTQSYEIKVFITVTVFSPVFLLTKFVHKIIFFRKKNLASNINNTVTCVSISSKHLKTHIAFFLISTCINLSKL